MEMRKVLLGVAAGLPFLLQGAGPAGAVSFGDAGAALQGVIDGITVSPPSSVDVTTDEVADAQDSLWSVTGTGASVGTLIVELAGLASTTVFGVYDAFDPSKQVTIFDGAASAGAQGLLSIKDDGSVFVNFVDTGVDFAGNLFGFFLDSRPSREANTGIWFSDTSLNPDGFDHMAAYQGTGDLVDLPGVAPGIWTPSEYILAWEDLHADIADGDFEDFVVMVESVQPVPIPGAAWLFGSGLLAIVGFARRRRQVA
jgi:hypothetical protein